MKRLIIAIHEDRATISIHTMFMGNWDNVGSWEIERPNILNTTIKVGDNFILNKGDEIVLVLSPKDKL